jgi:cell division protein ZapA
MALVNVMVNSRAYTIACDDGEEDHLREMAAKVDGKVREVLEAVGQVGDQRLMLMAALLVADEADEAQKRLDAGRQELGDMAGTTEAMSAQLRQSEQAAVDALEKAAQRAETLAAELGQA